MIRLSKLADYGIVVMTSLADHAGRPASAAELAQKTGIPQPTVGKILKALARADLLRSQRGLKGGYLLALDAEQIDIASIIEALDGPIALTDCIDDDAGVCMIERLCPARTNWKRINSAIRSALSDITLAEMAMSIPEAFGVRENGKAARTEAAV